MIDLASIPEGYGISRDGIIHPVSCVSVTVGLDVTDAGGEIKGSIEQPAESLLRNAGKVIEAMVDHSNSKGIDEYPSGTDRSLQWRRSGNYWAPRDTENAYMQFGTGTTAVTVRDFTLVTIVYDARPTITLTTTSTNSTIKIVGTVTATGTATISEIHQRMTPVKNTANTTCKIIVARDVFNPGLSVVSGDIITGKYIFSFDV